MYYILNPIYYTLLTYYYPIYYTLLIHIQRQLPDGSRSERDGAAALQRRHQSHGPAGRCHMPICPYVIVIELDKMHVIVFLSIFPIFPMAWTKSGLLTFFTYMAYADWSFCYTHLTYNVFSYILYMVYLILYTYDI
jgi:hypothetical protein